MSQGSSSSWATPVRGVRFSTDSEGGRHMTASPLTRTPSCVSNGRSKHNLAISPASCAVLPHTITPQTGPTTHSPGSFSLGRTKQFGAASPAKEVHGSAQCPTANVRSWNAQLTAWKQQSSQLRQDAEKMLATMPSHCRIGASTTITTTANDSSDLWVYRHLLFHEGLFAETSDKAAMSLKLTFENVEKTDVLIKFSVFDETMPYSVSLLREAIRSSPSPSVVSMSATCLVLELSTAIPGSIHPDEEKLATERARLPHDAQHLVSLRPSSSNSRLALAFTADIRAPFGHHGVVVGRLQNGFDFLEGVAGAALKLEDIHARFSTSD
ncbi:hypothetical protein AB1Y20_016860 [Prymnesium parvum]|uniref:Peptidylprolyl isomerase n=1 Tax=Prymnesium parvum TaxID=97485 RepID=A0AB34IBC7_PRYPA